MFRFTVGASVAWGLLVLAVGPVRAEESAAGNVLAGKGLKKVGSYWILPGEQDLQARLKSLAPKRHELDQALALRTRYEQDREKKRAALQNAVAERQRLVYLAAQAEDRRDYNAVVAQLSTLSAQIDALARYINDSGPSEQINRRVGAAGDALYGELSALRGVVDETRTRYAALAEDGEVVAALAALADESGRKVSLGPRKVFDKDADELKRYEAAIRSEEVKLRSENGIFWIEVELNGTTRVEMVFDTGASLISLPEDVARRAGVVATDSDPVLMMHLADGSTAEGRLVYLKEVRVGEFTVQNVEAVICPGDAGRVPPLLGGSFLQRFSINLNHAAGTLRLTSVNAPEKPQRSSP